jgi:4-amino-4-deoxy-L-arabinose transferase-like glycosyltransferase
VNTIPLPPSLRKEISNPVVLDVLIVSGLVLLALLAFYATPEFAANLPQDGVDLAVPAVNLLERGRLVVSAYGHDIPPSHPFGTSLLLLPAYMIVGHGLGNGIYALLLYALGAIALTYVLGVKLGGRWCGCVAAMFLITHYGFWQYSQKIMSEVPSVFLGTVVLALLLAIRDRERPGLLCLAVGVVLGFAATVRYDNLLLLAPSAVLLLRDGPWRERMRRVALCLAGVAPFIILLAAYDQVTFGSPWRTGYHYWAQGWDDTRQSFFSAQCITKPGFMRVHQIEGQLAGIVDGNAAFYAKSLLAESDTTRIFGHPLYWQQAGRRIYQALALLRSALGVMGLLACLAAWRTASLRKPFFLWLATATVACIGFYLVYYWQEERFLIRLVPAFCLANAIGVTVLLAAWPARATRVTVIAVVSALMAAFAFFNWQMGFPSGNDLHLYETLSQAARHMQSNAVIVSNFDPIRLDAYVIRGTDRIAVPLARDRDAGVFIGENSTPTFFHPFVASEAPERLRELLHSGRPVYWLIDDPWSGRPSIAFRTLQGAFRLQVLATASVNGGPEQPYFGRIHDPPQKH